MPKAQNNASRIKAERRAGTSYSAASSSRSSPRSSPPRSTERAPFPLPVDLVKNASKLYKKTKVIKVPKQMTSSREQSFSVVPQIEWICAQRAANSDSPLPLEALYLNPVQYQCLELVDSTNERNKHGIYCHLCDWGSTNASSKDRCRHELSEGHLKNIAFALNVDFNTLGQINHCKKCRMVWKGRVDSLTRHEGVCGKSKNMHRPSPGHRNEATKDVIKRLIKRHDCVVDAYQPKARLYRTKRGPKTRLAKQIAVPEEVEDEVESLTNDDDLELEDHDTDDFLEPSEAIATEEPADLDAEMSDEAPGPADSSESSEESSAPNTPTTPNFVLPPGSSPRHTSCPPCPITPPSLPPLHSVSPSVPRHHRDYRHNSRSDVFIPSGYKSTPFDESPHFAGHSFYYPAAPIYYNRRVVPVSPPKEMSLVDKSLKEVGLQYYPHLGIYIQENPLH